MMVMLAGVLSIGATPVMAEPVNGTETVSNTDTAGTGETGATDTTNTTETTETTEQSGKEDNPEGAQGAKTTCADALGAVGWLVCPGTGKIAEAVDWLHDKIEDILTINPVEMKDGSPIYEVWKYFRGVTNIVFIIFLLVVVYSQITGIGISNYGIKKVLPKLIVAAVLVNLSFMLCSVAVDASNIIGGGLRGLFESIETSTMGAMEISGANVVTTTELYTAVNGGAALAVGAGTIAFELGAIWMLIPTVLGAIVAVAVGLVTIAMRQAVVALLIMIAPLAVVAYMLPNTDRWFNKWRELLAKMLVFYPMFSLLFGASELAGWAIIVSAKDGFGVMLGVAVQIFPLFFSWSLMKMSGTFLSTVHTKLSGLAAKPLAANRAWAESHRQQTNLRSLNFGKTPSSHLRRFLDNRKALREKDVENLQTLRKNESNFYVQRRISGKGKGYDGTKSQGNEEFLKPNKYTITAKEASTSHLLSEMATMDTAHALNNYGSYYVSESVRNRIKAAEAAGDKKLARVIEKSDAESQRAERAGAAYLEYSRAQMTKENDEEADFGFMVSQYLDATTNYDPNATDTEEGKLRMKKYRHFILSSAGGLGETGQLRVLGKIIARAAAVESNQRRDIGIVAAKFPPDKRNFRNFLFNYYIDDDGYATDKEGNRIETMRDDLRVNHPEDLVMWDKFDANGPYFDWYDVNGNYVTRIYKKDKSAIKELMTNFDAPINDPINNMLVIHAGVKEQPNSEIPVLRNMGLDAFRTTIGRALLTAPFKEKNAAFSPMVAEMVKKGYIKNYAQEYLAYLDSLNKATKPGAWNMQDSDAIDMFSTIMNPDNWEKVFPTELIRGYLNVNGEPIYGIRKDEDGNKIKVPAEEATREELLERIKEKYIIPAARKMTVMMSRQTQNTMDNQKVGTVEKWKKLKEVFDTKWGEGKMVDADPYEQDGDMRQITKEIRSTLYTVDENGNKHAVAAGGKHDGETKGNSSTRVNHAAQIFDIYNSSLDADDFVVLLSEYCAEYKETAWIPDQLQDFIVSEGYGVTKEQIYEKIEELLAYVDYD
ncbi:hypothetical protein IJH33_00735 [Candidatus Saccharibacteria bacterium]|nr:hypothetical protein [Candidatus Saccharibacteria bacterium]